MTRKEIICWQDWFRAIQACINCKNPQQAISRKAIWEQRRPSSRFAYVVSEEDGPRFTILCGPSSRTAGPERNPQHTMTMTYRDATSSADVGGGSIWTEGGRCIPARYTCTRFGTRAGVTSPVSIRRLPNRPFGRSNRGSVSSGMVKTLAINVENRIRLVSGINK